MDPVRRHGLIQVANVAMLGVQNVQRMVSEVNRGVPRWKLRKETLAKKDRAGWHKVVRKYVFQGRNGLLPGLDMNP
jgi:hypothetical protein